MKQSTENGEQNKATIEQQRDRLASDLAFLVVQAHRYCQRDVERPTDSKIPAEPKLESETRDIH